MISELKMSNAHHTPLGDRGKRKIHPHKFTLWVAIGSILMMFAGLTSAFIVKSNQVGWRTIEIPKIFWISTAAIVLSSITVQMALRSFKNGEMNAYRLLIGVTLLLGVAFVSLQWVGFQQLWAQRITFQGSGAGQFLYVIFGLHAVHVIGGIVALIVMFMKAFASKTRVYSSVPVEVVATYWHFVDLLWIYLLVFFIVIS
ncbi:MAG TPA: cytochrome c oxidase subunit 3 [Chitinophagaceae bacterium]|nr:cytochrome c oxidase subunit 3 [Chitinophagaceae bacterium]